MSELARLPELDGVIILPMLTPSHGVDLFLGDLSRRSRSKTGRTAESYGRLLDKFAASLRSDSDVTEITSDDCRRFLDRYARSSPGYQHTIYSTLNSFLEWLYQQQRIKRNPLDFVPRPRRLRPDDLDVVTVSTADASKLLAATDTVSEEIAINVLAYLGPRRNAVAALRRSDYDREGRNLRFREKGSKTIWKQVPHELADVLDAAIDRGALVNDWQPEDPYLIPPEGPLQLRERNDRIIWRLVKNVAWKAGVEAHVHALRAAFACFYLESGGDLVGLQELMGHDSIETTRVYLRKLNKRRSMEPVRGLSWAAVAAGNRPTLVSPHFAVNTFKASPVVGAGGFEPPFTESPHHDSGHHQQTLDEVLQDRAVELTDPVEVRP